MRLSWWMRLLFAAGLLLPLAGVMAAAERVELPEDLRQKHEQMLYPVVRVTVGNGGGSGTIIYSEDRGDGCQTYVLTNHHVVSDAIKVKEEWSSLLQADVKREANDEVKIEVFRYTNGSRQDFTDACQAEIVAHDKNHDLALLRLKTSRKSDYVAALLPADTQVFIFQPMWAVGCSLLHPPVATAGTVTYLEDVIDRKNYWMGNAQIIFGNSGGAVFLKDGDRYCFAGVPSRVAVTWGTVVTHMGFFIPPTRVREWSKAEKLDFLTNDKSKPSDCFKLREQLRLEAERRKLGEKREPTPATPLPDRGAS